MNPVQKTFWAGFMTLSAPLRETPQTTSLCASSASLRLCVRFPGMRYGCYP
jgi:hypothetical protein